MPTSHRVTALVLLTTTALPLPAIHLRRGNAQRRSGANLALRKRLHVNTLIADPGTGEIDWSSLYSFTNSLFAMPSTLKYTPTGRHIAWGRTEYSLSFDALDDAPLDGDRSAQFGQSVTATATAVLFDGERLDIAFAPQATVFLRDESGIRLGATAIARYDVGRNSIGGTVSWSSATRASSTNPAGTLDAGIGFGRRLGASGLLGKFTPHVNEVYERSTGFPALFSSYEGVEYQMTARLAFDITAQHVGVSGGPRDHQVVFGITLGVGHLH